MKSMKRLSLTRPAAGTGRPFWENAVRHLRLMSASHLAWRLFWLCLVFMLAVTGFWLADGRSYTLLDETCYPAVITVKTEAGSTRIMSYQPTLIDALDATGIRVGENDRLSLPDNWPLQPGRQYDLTLIRREQITLNWAGLAVNTDSEPLDSADLLSRSGFSELMESGSASTIQHDKASHTLSYVDVDHQEYRETESIPFSTVYVDDPTIYTGQTKVRTPGETGSRVLIYMDTFKNGLFIERTELRTEIVKQPVQKVIAHGTRKKVKKIVLTMAPLPSSIRRTVSASWNKIKDRINPHGTRNYASFKDNGNGTITVDGKKYKVKTKSSRKITQYDGLEVCQSAGCHTPAINHGTSGGLPAQRGLIATYGYRSDGKLVGTNLPYGAIVFVDGYGLGVIADIHGVKSSPTLLDVCFDAGEIAAGTADLAYGNHTVYILTVP